MKSILISIKPKYVAKILNGEKNIEIRKTMPKCDLPIDVYIYCTKDKPYLAHATELFTGKYGCISNDEVSYEEHDINGKVVAKFTLNKVEHFEYDTCSRDIHGYWLDNGEVFKNKGTCLKSEELFDYIKGKDGYAWHISNLVIFDKPKELSEFYSGFKYKYCKDKFSQDTHIDNNGNLIQPIRGGIEIVYKMTKAPQSWCYIEGDSNV